MSMMEADELAATPSCGPAHKRNISALSVDHANVQTQSPALLAIEADAECDSAPLPPSQLNVVSPALQPMDISPPLSPYAPASPYHHSHLAGQLPDDQGREADDEVHDGEGGYGIEWDYVNDVEVALEAAFAGDRISGGSKPNGEAPQLSGAVGTDDGLENSSAFLDEEEDPSSDVDGAPRSKVFPYLSATDDELRYISFKKNYTDSKPLNGYMSDKESGLWSSIKIVSTIQDEADD
jgi:hypothetical protein